MTDYQRPLSFFDPKYAAYPSCLICGAAEETGLHALRGYKLCNKVWKWLVRKSELWDFL